MWADCNKCACSNNTAKQPIPTSENLSLPFNMLSYNRTSQQDYEMLLSNEQYKIRMVHGEDVYAEQVDDFHIENIEKYITEYIRNGVKSQMGLVYLCQVARNHDTAMIKKLVEFGVTQKELDLALLLASFEWFFNNLAKATIKLLVESGADIHANNEEALLGSIEMGNLEQVKFMVECGANVTAQALKVCDDFWLNKDKFFKDKIYNELRDYLIISNTKLNVHAKPFVPLSVQREDELFDKLEQAYVSNNKWLFDGTKKLNVHAKPFVPLSVQRENELFNKLEETFANTNKWLFDDQNAFWDGTVNTYANKKRKLNTIDE